MERNAFSQPATVRALRSEEIDLVAGGMKWTRGTSNSDVVDARGGTFKFMGITFALDSKGNISGIL